MRTLTFRQATAEMIARAEHAPDAIQAAKDAVLDEALQQVEESWPIDTGLTQEGWERDDTAILNDVLDARGRVYVSYVHDGLADRLVPLVLEGLVDLFAETLTTELESAAAGV